MAFREPYEVTLSDKLKVEFCVLNPEKDKKGRGNDGPIDFTAALHTYVEVLDASKKDVLVRGQQEGYIDPGDPIRQAPGHPGKRRHDFRRRAVRSRVPGDGAGDDASRGDGRCGGGGEHGGVDRHRGVRSAHHPARRPVEAIVCVESAAISEKVTLKPEDVWRAETNLTVVDL